MSTSSLRHTLFGMPGETPRLGITQSSKSLPLVATVNDTKSIRCPSWLMDNEWNANTTLEDVNSAMMARNIPGIIFVAIQLIFGLLGNSVVILAYSLKFKKSNYRVYVLFLASLDLMTCVFTMPFVILYLLYPKNFPSNFICKAGHFIGFFGGCASPFVLILIAVDRYRRICRPFRKQITERQTRISCLAIVIFTLLVTWFTPMFYGNERVHTGINDIYEIRCFRSRNPLFHSLSQWYYIILTSLFVVVTIVLFVLYYHIMKTVHQRSKQFTNKSSLGGVNKSIRTKKTTVTFMIITIVYVLSTVVHDCLAMVLHVREDLECLLDFTDGAVFYTFFWTVFLNNVSNPIIYGLSDERFFLLVKHAFERSTQPMTLTATKTSSNISKLSSKKQLSVDCDIKINGQQPNKNSEKIWFELQQTNKNKRNQFSKQGLKRSERKKVQNSKTVSVKQVSSKHRDTESTGHKRNTAGNKLNIERRPQSTEKSTKYLTHQQNCNYKESNKVQLPFNTKTKSVENESEYEGCQFTFECNTTRSDCKHPYLTDIKYIVCQQSNHGNAECIECQDVSGNDTKFCDTQVCSCIQTNCTGHQSEDNDSNCIRQGKHGSKQSKDNSKMGIKCRQYDNDDDNDVKCIELRIFNDGDIKYHRRTVSYDDMKYICKQVHVADDDHLKQFHIKHIRRNISYDGDTKCYRRSISHDSGMKCVRRQRSCDS